MSFFILNESHTDSKEVKEHKTYFPFYEKNLRFNYKLIQSKLTINLYPQSPEEQSRVKKWYNEYSNSIPMQRKHENIIMYNTTKIKESTSSYSITFDIYEGNLTKYFDNPNTNISSLDEVEIQKFVKGILNGVFILYDKRKIKTIVLTPDNIFLSKNTNKNSILPIPVIFFFSPSLLITKQLDMENFLYFPPELLMNKNNINEIHSSALLWMLGVICFKLMFDKLPFGNEHSHISKEEFTKIVLKGEYTVPLTKPISYEFLMFVTTLLQYNPVKRESFDEIKTMPFLNGRPQKFKRVKSKDVNDSNSNSNSSVHKELKLSIYRNTELLVLLYEQMPDIERNQNFEGENKKPFDDHSLSTINVDITMNNSIDSFNNVFK